MLNYDDKKYLVGHFKNTNKNKIPRPQKNNKLTRNETSRSKLNQTQKSSTRNLNESRNIVKKLKNSHSNNNFSKFYK